jgi:hypothetical protein
VNGKPVKEYLAADDRFGFGALIADDLDRIQRQEADLRRLVRLRRAEFRGRIEGLLTDTATTNWHLRTVAEGLLVTLGYHKHNRGEWRMRRDVNALKNVLSALEAQAGPKPLVKYSAPDDEPAVVELFAKVRAGDAEALGKLHVLIRERKWVG